MKFWMIMALLCVFVSAEAQTYRAGGSSRPRFGAGASAEEQEESSVPGANSSIKTRTFSNYSARQRDWSKGVQTKTVQTDTAGSKNFEDTAAAQSAQAVQALQAMAGGAPAPAAASQPAAGGKKAAAETPEKASSKTAGNAAAAPAAAAGQPDTAAMMQQMQGMMQGLSGMMGAMGGGAAGGASQAGSAGKGAAAGMNVPGMPDMSALLNAASAGQQPAKK